MLTFSADDLAKAFIARHEAEVRPLEKASNLAWWVANVSGKDADFAAKEQAQNRLDAALADRDRFAQLKKIKEGSVSDPLLARQVDVLYLMYLEKQVFPRAAQEDHGQGERGRAGFQRLPGQAGRQGDSRQQGPLGPQGVDQLGHAAEGLGVEQGRRQGGRGRPEGAGEAPQPGGDAARVPELPRHGLHLNEQRRTAEIITV